MTTAWPATRSSANGSSPVAVEVVGVEADDHRRAGVEHRAQVVDRAGLRPRRRRRSARAAGRRPPASCPSAPSRSSSLARSTTSPWGDVVAGDLGEHHRHRGGQAVVRADLRLVVGDLGHRLAVDVVVVVDVLGRRSRRRSTASRRTVNGCSSSGSPVSGSRLGVERAVAVGVRRPASKTPSPSTSMTSCRACRRRRRRGRSLGRRWSGR